MSTVPDALNVYTVVSVFGEEITLPGRCETRQAAPTPSRQQLCWVVSPAGKLSGHYNRYRVVQHEINGHSMMDLRYPQVMFVAECEVRGIWNGKVSIFIESQVLHKPWNEESINTSKTLHCHGRSTTCSKHCVLRMLCECQSPLAILCQDTKQRTHFSRSTWTHPQAVQQGHLFSLPEVTDRSACILFYTINRLLYTE